MAITRDVAVLSSMEDGLVQLFVEWEYDDVNQVGVRVHGVRVKNHTAQNVVYKLWVYGVVRGTTRTTMYEAEFMPNTDTGMVPIGPLTVRSGGFNFAFQPWRYAT